MPRLRVRVIAIPMIALALIVAACSGGTDEPTRTSSPTPGATMTVSPAPATASPSPTPSPTPSPAPDDPDAADWAVRVYPTATRTGIDVIDRALDAVLAGDAAALAALADFRERPCTTAAEGIGSLPCPEGVADETLLPVIQLAFCEGTYVSPEAVGGSAEALFRYGPDGTVGPLRLYAVARIDDDPTLSDSHHRLLFAFPHGVGRQVWVNDAGVTMLWWGCGEVPVAQMTVISSSAPETEYLLPPRAP